MALEQVTPWLCLGCGHVSHGPKAERCCGLFQFAMSISVGTVEIDPSQFPLDPDRADTDEVPE